MRTHSHALGAAVNHDTNRAHAPCEANAPRGLSFKIPKPRRHLKGIPQILRILITNERKSLPKRKHVHAHAIRDIHDATRNVETRTTEQCIRGQIGGSQKRTRKHIIQTNAMFLEKISQDWVSEHTCMYCACRKQSSPRPMHNGQKANIVPSEEIEYKKNGDE